MPTQRALIAFSLITLALVVSVVAPWLIPVALVADALIMAALAVDHRRASRAPLAASRVWPALLVQDVECPLFVRVATGSARGIALVAREALHPSLAPLPQRRAMIVPGGGSVTWRLTLAPRRRGEPLVGPLTVRVRGPLGLAWSQRELLAPERRRVYPQIRWEGTVGRLLALAHRRQLGRTPLKQHGAGSEPYALREYRPGDPQTKIHWKATARHGRLIARDDTWERGSRLTVLLDCGRAMAAVDAGRSKLDHALAATLALSRVAAGRGDHVRIVAYSDRIERHVRVRPGSRSMARAYESLYDVSAKLTEPAYDVAAEAVSSFETRRSIVVLLTSLADLAAAELLRESVLALSRRHRPILVNLEDPHVTALAFGRPSSSGEAFAKVMSLEILLANRRLARRLRRNGVVVVTTPSDRLALKTLETYLTATASR
jgi:uncharacterized protein (DUF58 family)